MTSGYDNVMTSKERFLAALDRRIPDRLPVTTHHVMPYFLKTCLGGMTTEAFFDAFGLDPIDWVTAHRPREELGHYFEPGETPDEPPRLASPDWFIEAEAVPDPGYRTVRYRFHTPGKTLTMVIQSNDQTGWVSERLVKEKSDVDVLADHLPAPVCDVEAVNRRVEAYGDRGLVRGMVPGFDPYGQPGCWQDAAVLYGIEALILETFHDPAWVHHFLEVLQERKKTFVQSLEGARFDLVEYGGGDASSTLISPQIFDDFVAPYDAEVIDLAHAAGQRIVYHTCGGMMPILESIAAMGPDAMETFTPVSMGGDVDLAEARCRLGDRVCMIGGFDQFHHFLDCAPETTRQAVRDCFESAGRGGGYILAPSDHFFDADPDLIRAFADEARMCIY